MELNLNLLNEVNHDIYILATLLISTKVFSGAYQFLEVQPDFIKLEPQTLSNIHYNQAQQGFGDALIHASYVEINLDALNVIRDNKGKFVNIKNTQMAGHQIVLQLPGISKNVILEVKTALNLSSEIDIVTYSGVVLNQNNSRFVLSVSAKEGVVGTINFDKYVYNIMPTNDFINHIVTQVIKSKIPRSNINDVVSSKFPDKSVKTNDNNKNSNGLVKILFYVASDVPSPYSTVMNTVAEMNTILKNSAVALNNRISITDSVVYLSLNTSFSGKCILDILHEMKNSQGFFSDVDQKLQVYGADLAVTFVKGNTSANPNNYCRVGGYAALYGLDKTLSQGGVIGTDPFAVIADNYATSSGDLTAVHEIGHVLGGKHATTDTDDSPILPLYSRGFYHTSSSNNFQTIMGSYNGNVGCHFNGPKPEEYLCERIAKFSNPNLKHNNINIGAYGSSDMRLWLNSKMKVVSNWTGNPIQVPPSPVLSATNELCYGLNSLNWNTVITGTEYKLYKSTSANFQNINLIYNGVNTASIVNVNSGTWYLRVKACNVAGCSSYSNQVTAYRFNGCI